MPLRIVVDTENGLAPWRQVHDQIVRAIIGGAMAEDTRLPPIRQLARDLGLASGTIARVYRELEAAGLVVTARARGTVVTGSGARTDRAALLDIAAAEFAQRAQELGTDAGSAIEAVRKAYGS